MTLTSSVFRTVDSFHQFIQESDRSGYTEVHSSDWTGGVIGRSVARDMAVTGWAEKRPDAEAIIDRVIGDVRPLTDDVRQLSPSLMGGVVNVPAYLSGRPDSMLMHRRTRKITTKRVLSVLVDAGANSHVSADHMLRRSAAVGALMEVVQRLGLSLSIDLTSPIKDRGHRHNIVLRLHPAGGHFDLDVMMFCLGHPAFHRYLWFSHRHADGVGSGMGTSIDIDDALAEQYDLVVRRDEHSDGVLAGDDPQQWVINALGKLGLL